MFSLGMLITSDKKNMHYKIIYIKTYYLSVYTLCKDSSSTIWEVNVNDQGELWSKILEEKY